MPHITVKLYPGRTEAQKQSLTSKIVTLVMSELDCPEMAVSVAFEEVPREKWAKSVYKPEIMDKESQLYKKPGYKPADDELT